MTIHIHNTTKKASPKAPFLRYKNAVLGDSYELTLTFIGTKRMRTLNNVWRKKDYATDILSFPLDKKSGEIYICEKAANKKAKDFDRTPENYLKFLVIHGLVHLKGYDHGSRMDHEELKWQKLFKI